ncbi:unnamed protein product [Larinioides sclopetarius]|uniref:Uncharacterized protein n=1 Tax=Larinioides sclopetarius TaxID=280406 RepID=A0AAV1Z3Q9_9ARAC
MLLSKTRVSRYRSCTVYNKKGEDNIPAGFFYDLSQRSWKQKSSQLQFRVCHLLLYMKRQFSQDT